MMNSQKKPFGFEIGFVTKNVDEAYRRAIDAGATSVSKSILKPWGQVVFYVKDINGFLVEICTPMS